MNEKKYNDIQTDQRLIIFAYLSFSCFLYYVKIFSSLSSSETILHIIELNDPLRVFHHHLLKLLLQFIDHFPQNHYILDSSLYFLDFIFKLLIEF